MPAVQAIDLARLKELRRRFDEAAYAFPGVDAFVVFRPDLRREEAEREAKILHFKPANPDSENYGFELGEETKSAHAAIRFAVLCEAWVPPSDKTVVQLGGQKYWTHHITADDDIPFHGLLTVWECCLFRSSSVDIENTWLRRFDLLAADAAHLLLPSTNAKGKALLSLWLIHLADRAEPIVAESRRQYLSWPTVAGMGSSPFWIPVTPLNRPTLWWAARIPNVFRISRLVVEQSLDVAASAPDASILTSEDKTILVVLLNAGRALIFSDIVREAARLVRESHNSARKDGLILLSESKVRERVPILEGQGFVSRPQGPLGRTTSRKGIGINDLGRSWLESNSSFPR